MKVITLFLLSAAPLAFLSACSSIPGPDTHTEEQRRTENSLTLLDDWQPEAQPQAAYEDIWQRIIASYQLDLNSSNPRIDSQLNWYKSHQNYLDRVAERGVRYLHFIAEQIEARGVPGELALLPIVESAFEPFAYSHGRASGVWQFIPATGRDFGLQQDWWHDGRRDIRASTEAALTYLSAVCGICILLLNKLKPAAYPVNWPYCPLWKAPSSLLPIPMAAPPGCGSLFRPPAVILVCNRTGGMTTGPISALPPKQP